MQQGQVMSGVGPLSQVERVVDTFIAPGKTFTDILRSTSWWLPFLLFLVMGFANAFAIGKTVGWDAVAQRQIELNAKQADQMAQLTPEQRAHQIHAIGLVNEGFVYASGVIVIVACALFALLYWASFNFGLGASTTYGQMFALCFYASLPRLVLSVLNIVLLFAGVNTENYDIKNPVGTNLAYFMPNAAPALRPLLSALDIFTLWTLVLSIIGGAIIARKSIGQSAAVMIGWSLLFVLIGTGFAAAFS